MKKTLKEIAEEKGKQLFIESFTYVVHPDDVEIFSETKLIESIDGTKFKAKGILKNVDISRYTENLNKRIYSKVLWETVKKKKMGEGSVSLTGHPEDEGDPEKIAGIWHGLEIGESTPTSNLYMVGKHGELMLEVLEAGGTIGFSSVGFGELKEDGKTVEESSYECERLGDWVLTPSQQVYASKENLVNSSTEAKKKIESFNVKVTNKSNDNIKQTNKKEVNVMLDKVQEGNLRNQVRISLREAKKNENISESLVDLSEIAKTVPEEFTDIHEKIEKTIEELQNKFEEQVQNATKTLVEKDKSIDDLKIELDEKTEELVSLNEKHVKLESIIKKLDEGDLKLAKENIQLMEKDINQFVNETELRDHDITCLVEDREIMQADIDQLVEDHKKLEVDIEQFENIIVEHKENYNDVLTHLRKLEEAIESEMGYEVDKYEEKKKTSEEEEDDKKDDKEDEKKDDDKKDDDKKDDDKKDDKDDMDEKNKDEKKDNKKKDEKKEASDDDKDIKKDVDDKENSGQGKEGKEKKEKKKESLNLRQQKRFNPEVYDFYKKYVEEKPSVKNIKEQILGAKSLAEAVQLIEKFNDNSDTLIKIDESKIVKPNWLEGRI